MQYKEFGSTFILKFEQHEELIRELKKFCEEKNIKNASLTGIGAINSITLGFYDTSKQTYIEQSMHRPFELSSLMGNISTENPDSEHIIHLHATISDKDFRTYGGHVFRAIVSKTIEVVLTVIN